jgi:hypothetical protein
MSLPNFILRRARHSQCFQRAFTFCAQLRRTLLFVSTVDQGYVKGEKMDNPNNRRMIVGVIVSIAVMFGVLSLATMSSYNQGLVDGMARGTQIVVPNNSAQVMPAPYVYQQPYNNSRSGGPGFFGIVLNVLGFIVLFFIVTRVLRFAFGRRRWGGGPWGHGNGDWQKWHDWRNGPPHGDPRNAQSDFRNTPNKPDEQVI